MAATESVTSTNSTYESSLPKTNGALSNRSINPNVKIVSQTSETTNLPSLKIHINLSNLQIHKSDAKVSGASNELPSTDQNTNSDKNQVETESGSTTESDTNDGNAFSDSMDVSQLDAIVEQGHKTSTIQNSNPSLENANEQDTEPSKALTVSNKRSNFAQAVVCGGNSEGKLLVTLKFPEIPKFIHGSKGWGVSARKLSHMNITSLQHKARLLVVSVNMLLETTKLPESSKKILERVHNCFLKQLSTMTLDKVRVFVLRLYGYLMSLRNVIEGKEKMDVEKSLRESASLMDVSSIEKEIKEQKKRSATESKKTKKRKVTKRRKRKPKLPYARYHFPIPVDDMTTFGGLTNALNDDEDEEDDELVEESMVMSLLDPISGSRLVTPLRTRFCSHIECFDMASFLAMNKLRPFKVGIRHERPLPSGEPNIAAIFRDTRRHPLNPDAHNHKTTEFEYKSEYKRNKEKGKYNNNLEFFKCPICRIEFSIKVPGDVYVVGELVDLLFNMDQEGHEKSEKVEISHDGTGTALEEEPEEVKIQKNNEIVEINLDDESSSEENNGDEQNAVKKEISSVKESEPSTAGHQSNSLGGTAIMSSDTDDSWDAEFQELDKVLDENFFVDGVTVPSAAWEKNDNAKQGRVGPDEINVGVQRLLTALQNSGGNNNNGINGLPQRGMALPPPPPPATAQYQPQYGGPRMGSFRVNFRPAGFTGYSQPVMYANRRQGNNSDGYHNLRRTATYGPPGGAAGDSRGGNESAEPVFFTGNGIEDDPFVID